MADPRDQNYPNGKPLCRYEEGKIIVHEEFGQSRTDFIDSNGRFTGNMEMRDVNGNLLSKMDSNIFTLYDEAGNEKEINPIVQDENPERQFIYSSDRKTLKAIIQRSPVDNSVVKLTSLYASGNLGFTKSYKDNLLNGAVNHYRNDSDNSIEQKISYDSGRILKADSYDETGTKETTQIYQDASAGDFTEINYKKNGTVQTNEYKNNILAEAKLEKNGLVTGEAEYNAKGHLEKEKRYQFVNNKQRIDKVFTYKKWNENGVPICGHMKEYEFDGKQVIDSADIVIENGQRRYSGLWIEARGNNQGFLTNVVNNDLEDEECKVKTMMDENGELCAYSDGYSNPKTRKALDPSFSG